MKLCLLLIALSSFSVSSIAQCDPAFTFIANGAEVTFNASTNSQDIEHNWNFGDGSFPLFSGASVTHQFITPGSYAVSHVVKSKSTGCADSTSVVIDVEFQVNCDAGFTIIKDSIYPQKYRLLPNSISGIPTIYEWKLDGKVIGSDSPFSLNLPEGDHQICLKVIVSNCETSSCQNINVTASGDCNWNATINATPDPSDARKLTVQPGTILPSMKFRWFVGDFMTSTQSATSIEFPASGDYNIRLHITDTVDNCFDKASIKYNVPPRPADLCTTGYVANVDAADPFSVSFSAISNQDIISQKWKFISADSAHKNVVNALDPTFKFPDTGYYYVQLETVTATGCKGFYWNYINITGPTFANNLVLSPNPVYGSQIKIRLEFERQEFVMIDVFNSSGNRVFSTRHSALTGINHISIPVDRLQRGLYYVRIQGSFTRSKKTFIKM